MNKNMCLLENMWFHDSTIESFRWNGGSIEIMIRDVVYGDKLVMVCLTILQVAILLIDDAPVRRSNVSLMETKSGDVMRLDISDRNVFILVEWLNYSNKNDRYLVRTYHISGEDISILIGDEMQDP